MVAAGPALTVTLSYADPSALLAAQDWLAAALPDLPELALLDAALSTRYLAWPVSEGLVAVESGYKERVDLGARGKGVGRPGNQAGRRCRPGRRFH